jgi:hypothetical protein
MWVTSGNPCEQEYAEIDLSVFDRGSA